MSMAFFTEEQQEAEEKSTTAHNNLRKSTIRVYFIGHVNFKSMATKRII